MACICSRVSATSSRVLHQLAAEHGRPSTLSLRAGQSGSSSRRTFFLVCRISIAAGVEAGREQHLDELPPSFSAAARSTGRLSAITPP